MKILSKRDVIQYGAKRNVKAKAACERAARIVQETLQRYIDDYYSEYDPFTYSRTDTFRDSLVRTDVQYNNGRYEATIFVDTSIRYPQRLDGTIGWTVGDTAHLANQGYHGSPDIKVSDMRFFEDAYAEIVNDKSFINSLKDKGITVRFRRVNSPNRR